MPVTRILAFALVFGFLVLTSFAGADTALPREDPEAHQVDSAALAAAFDAADDLDFVRGMVVARDGVVIGEDHFGTSGDGFRQSHSVTKSVTSLLIGIAIDRGDIPEGIAARLIDYLPPGLVPNDPAKAEIRLGHLLTMTSGFEWDEDLIIEWQSGLDPAGNMLSRPLSNTPGTRFQYSTGASHLLSVALATATGMSTQDFADEVLFGPLGITERFWQFIGGYHNGGNGLYLRTESLAKLGVMVLGGGVYEGNQVVPAWWINSSTIASVLNLGSFGPLTRIDYGWLWWLDDGTDYNLFTAWGWAGQFIFCVPALDLVVGVHSNTTGDPHQADLQEEAVLDIIVDRILPAVTDRRVFSATGLEVPELAAVDAAIRDTMQEHDISKITAAVTKDGRLVYARGFTWDEASVEPVEPTALFRTGSIGKAIASLAIHRLLDDGLLTYQTPVQPVLEIEPLPGGVIDSRFDEVTVDHLLTHTGGMYSEDNIYEVSDRVAEATGDGPPATQDEILSYIMSRPFVFEPGDNWDYNNYGYMMLDQLVNRLTDRHFADFVNEEFFRPVGVGRARVGHGLVWEKAPTEVDYDGLEGDPHSVPIEAAVAAGGWVMAAPDLARLWSVLFDESDAGGLLTPTTREAMFTSPFPASEVVGYWRGWYGEELISEMNVSLGWLSDPDDGFTLRGHSGGGSGVATFAFWHSDNIVLTLFSNKDPIAEEVLFPEIAIWPEHDLWSTVGVSTEPVGAAETEAWIPVAAHGDGVGSSTWRTDLGLLNRSSMVNHVRLRLNQDGGSFDHELVLAPNSFDDLVDVVGLFDRTGSGPLRVFSSEPLTVASRTYNIGANGTFGQFLSSVAPTQGLAKGEEALLIQLREDDAFRSNIGLVNGWRRNARVAVDLVDGDGTLIATTTRNIPAETTIQMGRPFEDIGGRTDVRSGWARVRVIEGQHVFAYASVVDNTTNDPTTIPMKTGQGSSRCFIAAAASGDGAHGSTWRTDLALLNLSGDAATVELRFRGNSVATTIVSVGNGEQLLVEDVVTELGAVGSGSLEVFSDRPVFAGSRTYNLGDEGTFGQFLDGTPDEALAGEGETLWLPQLRQSADFRSNIGFVNTSSADARIRVRLFDGDGAELAATTRNLAPHQRRQLQEPFDQLAGSSDLNEAYASVTVEYGGGVLVYASVIDNATNDPVTVPMVY